MLTGERKRWLVVARGKHPVVVDDLDRGPEVERPPLERGVAEPSRARQRFLDLGQAEADVARAELDRRVAEQGLDPFRRVTWRAFERLSEPVPRLAELDAAQPERPHLCAQAQRFLRIR